MRPHRKLVLTLCLLTSVGAATGTAQTPGAQQRARINDIDMAYLVQGTGEPLLLLHGFGGCGRDWAPFVEQLAQHYQVIVPDLRGHGGSTNPATTFTHRQSGDDVLALLDHLGLPRARAMGISTGGMTLLHAATKAPERIDAMVLIGATSWFPGQARAIMREVGKERPPGDSGRGTLDRAWRGACSDHGPPLRAVS